MPRAVDGEKRAATSQHHKANRAISQSLQNNTARSADTTHSKSVKFPAGYQLLATTSRGVYAWDMSGVSELFNSGSAGIVASKKVAGDNGTLAVADDQVVLLHDVKKGMQKSYRLKGSEVRLMILLPSARLLTSSGPSQTP